MSLAESSEMIIRYQWGRGELFMSLVLHAQSAVFWHDEAKDLSRRRPESAADFRANIAFYRQVMDEFKTVAHAARLTEIAVWFGRPDIATDDIAAASLDYSRPKPDCPSGRNAVQTYYRQATTTAHAFRHADFTALLFGSAGRVLLTIRDNLPFDDPNAKFGGANITAIYDETARHPRGGIESLVGNRDECLGLLKAMRDNPPEFAPDSNVCIG